MKIARSQARSATRSVPNIRFEDQSLTSFAGLVLFQRLFLSLNLRGRLAACVRHLKHSGTYGAQKILLVLTVHHLLGWSRLRDLDYYRDDPIVLQTLGLKRMPSVPTVSRTLRELDSTTFDKLRSLSQAIVLERVQEEGLSRLTLDFDGSVLSTKSRNTEGTAVGFNRKHKGQRSYYPLFCTLAQTGQVFDFLHRPGNVHDSNGAGRFIDSCLQGARNAGFHGVLEARIDSAHFNDPTCLRLDDQGVEFSVSVPFERFPELKGIIEGRSRWYPIDDEWSFFEVRWKPKTWPRRFRCICYRHRVKRARKGPIQLDLFEPIDFNYEYKVVMTNKSMSPAGVLHFHNGRGSQEGIFAELKSDLRMEYIPTRRLVGNQIYLTTAILAHNLNRELQIRTTPRVQERNTLKRMCLWVFETVRTFRKRLIQRAGRLTRPRGVPTLTVSGNDKIASEFQGALDALSTGT